MIKMTKNFSRQKAIHFVILFGFISLFADMTYEGARSISGQYLALLGASGAVVGTVAGAGELIGYGFRLVSGYISDRTGRYWTITFIGYFLNLLAVPLLALAGNWPLAASLMILERFGKAIRNPAKDALLSYATKQTGRGWGFGLHEAMDQIGAITGPLIVSGVLYLQGTYQASFAVLLIPALCALSVLVATWFLYPNPEEMEEETPNLNTEGFTKKYWLYIAAISCIAAGYVDFPLIAFHFEKAALLPEVWIPVLFAIAMAADGISALICGYLYDKIGFSVLIGVSFIAAFFAPCVFLGGLSFIVLGAILWGIGLGAQESIVRAVIANMVRMNKRATAYGLMNIYFGIAWFLGSALMGLLYDRSLILLVAFSLIAQFAALPLFFAVKRTS
jgi:MFS family permease